MREFIGNEIHMSGRGAENRGRSIPTHMWLCSHICGGPKHKINFRGCFSINSAIIKIGNTAGNPVSNPQ